MSRVLSLNHGDCILRGGSWLGRARYCRSAFRLGNDPGFRHDFLGFRCAAVQKVRKHPTPTHGGEGTSMSDLILPRRMLDLGHGATATLIQVPPGNFLMGSPVEEVGRWEDETQHEVEIPDAYWVWETPTTQAQWRAVMGTDPSEFKGPDRPVECVSWFDCVEFCKAMTKLMAGQFPDMDDFELPTEALWEYFCRAGTTGPLNVEGATLDQVAWFADNSEGQTHPVKLKLPNRWGFFDTLGNVCEWCQDEWAGR